MIIHKFYFTALLAPYSLRVFCWSLPKSGPIRKAPCAYPFSLVWNLIAKVISELLLVTHLSQKKKRENSIQETYRY
jgi:hypothetical protein